MKEWIKYIAYYLLFDIYMFADVIRGELVEIAIDEERICGGDGSNIPFFSVCGGFGSCIMQLIAIGFIVVFAIIMNSRSTKSLEGNKRFGIPMLTGLINAVIFMIFMGNTMSDWLDWIGQQRTVPYTVDGFGAALVYSNDVYYVSFVFHGIVMGIVTLISWAISKRDTKKRIEL